MEVISMLKTGLMNLLEKAMSGSTVRHNVLSNNISNVFGKYKSEQCGT